jgi:hypothetical protein
MDFSFSDKSVFEVYFDIGEWNTNSYHRFGIYVADNAALANLWSGSNLISGRLIGNFSLEPDTQYSLAIMIGNDGELMAVIWDVADPTKIISTHEQVGTSWVGHTWKFAVGANLGQVVFDNLRIVSFDEIN